MAVSFETDQLLKQKDLTVKSRRQPQHLTMATQSGLIEMGGAADGWQRQVHGICREHQRLQDQVREQSSAFCVC